MMEDEFDFIGECGFIKPVMQVTMDDVPIILSSVCREFLISRSSHEIVQFLEGLNTLGIATLIKVHPSSMKQLFLYDPSPVSSQEVADLMVPVFSPRGSNIREEEEAVFMNWNDYLHSAGVMRNCNLFFRLHKHESKQYVIQGQAPSLISHLIALTISNKYSML